jgi:hypothetical protein
MSAAKLSPNTVTSIDFSSYYASRLQCKKNSYCVTPLKRMVICRTHPTRNGENRVQTSKRAAHCRFSGDILDGKRWRQVASYCHKVDINKLKHAGLRD